MHEARPKNFQPVTFKNSLEYCLFNFKWSVFLSQNAFPRRKNYWCQRRKWHQRRKSTSTHGWFRRMSLDSHICRCPISDHHDHRYNDLQMPCKQSDICTHRIIIGTSRHMCVYERCVFTEIGVSNLNLL